MRPVSGLAARSCFQVTVVSFAECILAMIDSLADEEWKADQAEELLHWLCLGQHLSSELKQKHTACITQSHKRRACMFGLLYQLPLRRFGAEFSRIPGTVSCQLHASNICFCSTYVSI